MNPETAPTPDIPVRYRLRLQGHITYTWADWLPDAEVSFEGEGAHSITVVIGTVRDQSAFFGLLSYIRNLGVRLVSVESI
jgi:hypothetical protein